MGAVLNKFLTGKNICPCWNNWKHFSALLLTLWHFNAYEKVGIFISQSIIDCLETVFGSENIKYIWDGLWMVFSFQSTKFYWSSSSCCINIKAWVYNSTAISEKLEKVKGDHRSVAFHCVLLLCINGLVTKYFSKHNLCYQQWVELFFTSSFHA